ncbi:SAM-dependent methyltransferase [Novipirellula artificiosorum]|uniref:Cyclopropane-fatty-acyl-phospholipid synthase n=1 Tax=Novipirellula artificiosorum TaxID=2528016 RepID=A0A5C6E149_9BACT|nr:cyclopropane-fatty-acyl-phospholipid synthase family protein [Novipirellula artificiosorum]TWU40909.1 Cyclopropane-fatty-acyl-phospholipid synthase [Novipirellula artificiosorum]
MARIQEGQLTIEDRSGGFEFGHIADTHLAGTITVSDRRFYRSAVLGGALGAAESYLRGDWDSPDLTTVMRVMARNADTVSNLEKGISRVLRPFRALGNGLRRNTRSGSKRNIAAHYDLSNEFFALMLDPTMTYSSGIFPTPRSTLLEASIEKYDIVCRKLQLKPNDHVLEIGTGWGGFAEYAARQYGCRITTTTISDQQHAYAEKRFRAASLLDRITLLKQDYRELTGQYDKLVSIEMIEAVGEKYLPSYFEQCSQRLKPDGMMLLQAITLPDHRYGRYRKSVDFIQRYIFPGGFLPSISAIAACLGKTTDFRFFHAEDFGPHYAATLAQWRSNFWNNIEQVKQLGFDERFLRMWHYYLCYCEAGFQERQIGVSQLLLTKPLCRREPIQATL